MNNPLIELFTKLVDDYGIKWLSDGSCPCGDAYIFDIHIKTHCWRVANCCKYSGVHVWQGVDGLYPKPLLKQIGKIIAKYISEAYETECAVSLKEI